MGGGVGEEPGSSAKALLPESTLICIHETHLPIKLVLEWWVYTFFPTYSL